MYIDTLQNVNWRPPICSFVQKYTEIIPCQFRFWRTSFCILEAEIVLGVLYRKGRTPKKGGTLASPQISKIALRFSIVTSIFKFFNFLELLHYSCNTAIFQMNSNYVNPESHVIPKSVTHNTGALGSRKIAATLQSQCSNLFKFIRIRITVTLQYFFSELFT